MSSSYSTNQRSRKSSIKRQNYQVYDNESLLTLFVGFELEWVSGSKNIAIDLINVFIQDDDLPCKINGKLQTASCVRGEEHVSQSEGAVNPILHNDTRRVSTMQGSARNFGLASFPGSFSLEETRGLVIFQQWSVLSFFMQNSMNTYS